MDESPPLLKVRKSKVTELLDNANKALEEIKKREKILSITSVNQLYYATAVVISERTGLRQRKKKKVNQRKPLWKERMVRDIQRKRKDLSILSELSANNNNFIYRE